MNPTDPHDRSSNDGIQPWIDPHLEARVVAAVLGEASDFERAELETLLAGNPELAVFKRRIEAVHGLVGECLGGAATAAAAAAAATAATAAAVSTESSWKLAPGRRAALLEVLRQGGEGCAAGGEVTGARASAQAAQAAQAAPKGTRVRWRRWLGGLSAAAAALAVLGLLVSQFTLMRTVSTRAGRVALGEQPASAGDADSDAFSTGFAFGRSLTDSKAAGLEVDSSKGDDAGRRYPFQEPASGGVPQVATGVVTGKPAAGDVELYGASLQQLAEITRLGDDEDLVAQTGQRHSGNVYGVNAANVVGGNVVEEESLLAGVAAAPGALGRSRGSTAPAGASWGDEREEAAGEPAPRIASDSAPAAVPELGVAQNQQAGQGGESGTPGLGEVASRERSLFRGGRAVPADALTDSGSREDQSVPAVPSAFGGASADGARNATVEAEARLAVADADSPAGFMEQPARLDMVDAEVAGTPAAAPLPDDDAAYVAETQRFEGEAAIEGTEVMAGRLVASEGSVRLNFKEAAQAGDQPAAASAEGFSLALRPEVVEFEGSVTAESDAKAAESFAEGLPGASRNESSVGNGLNSAPAGRIAERAASNEGNAEAPGLGIPAAAGGMGGGGAARRLGGGLASGVAQEDAVDGESFQTADGTAQAVDGLLFFAAKDAAEPFGTRESGGADWFADRAGVSAPGERDESATVDDYGTLNVNAGFSTFDLPPVAENASGGAKVANLADGPAGEIGSLAGPGTGLVSQPTDPALQKQAATKQQNEAPVVEGNKKGNAMSKADALSLAQTDEDELEQLTDVTDETDVTGVTQEKRALFDSRGGETAAYQGYAKESAPAEGAQAMPGGAGAALGVAGTSAGNGGYGAAQATLNELLAQNPDAGQSEAMLEEGAEALQLGAEALQPGAVFQDLVQTDEAKAESGDLLQRNRASAASRSLIDKTEQMAVNGPHPTGESAGKGTKLAGAGNFNGAAEEMSKALEALPVVEGTEARSREFEETLEGVNARLAERPAPAFVPVTTTEEHASANAFSTFSLHVSDVAFKLAQAALARGEWPEPGKMRVEEFVNAFDYGDPAPAAGEKVACRTEQCAHPFLQQRNLLRIALRTAAVGRTGGQPLRLTILLDHSGSMQREDREASVRRAMEVLAGQLQPSDQVSLLGFARTPRLLADRIGGAEAGRLLEAVAAAPSEGGTNLEVALQLAAEVAERQFDHAAVNRVVLMTDGAANLGNASPEVLARRVVELRQKGIAFDACGVGANGLNDAVLEALTRDGDGRYYFLDSPEQADAGFASQLAGALRPAARNVKVQVVFNPDRVGAYRLFGFEKHRLKKEDFRDDAVDAAEMAAEEAGVALYQLEAKADGRGDIGEVRVRFQDVETGRMIEHNWIIPYVPDAPAFAGASPSLQLAGTAATFAEYLRGGPEASNVELDVLAGVAPNLRGTFGANVRVNQLNAMIHNARNAR